MAAEMVDGIAHINWELGGPCLSSGCTLHTCARCGHHTEKAYEATTETHRISNRSSNPFIRPVGLCVQCWSELVRDEYWEA